MRLKNYFAVALVFAIAGCATGKPRGYLSGYAQMKPQFQFDKAYVAPDAKFGQYPSLAVEVVNKAPASSLGEAKSKLLVQKFQDELVGRIQQTGVFARVTKVGSERSPSLILRAFVTALDPGSHAMRFWVGMGAGAARVEMEGEVVDPSTNESLFRFVDARSGDDIAGVFGSEELMEDDLSAQAKRIAEVFATHR